MRQIANHIGNFFPDRLSFPPARIIAVAIAAVVAFGAMLRVPEPIVDTMLESDLRSAAEVWQSRILQQLSAGTQTFDARNLTGQDLEFLNNIPNTSDVYRVTFIDNDGLTFFSTLQTEIGKTHGEGRYHEDILKGKTVYRVEWLQPEQVEGLELHISSSDHYAIREIAMIDLPVFHNGRFVGAIEFLRDITVLRETFLLRMRLLVGAMAVFGFALCLAGFWAVARANRQRVRGMQAQSEHERSIMQDQMRMAREVRLLGELNEWLQSSRSLDELFEMVARFMTHLFPDCEGSVYVYSNSRDVLDGCASWNGGQHREHIQPEECWGLRRGRTYAYGQSEIDFTCAHAEPNDGRPYTCFPILAHGETVGLLHLQAKEKISFEAFSRSRKLAQTSAEQISLAIANVRMQDQLQDQSIRDPLTGLFNRRHLTESLRKFIAHTEKTGERVSIISIDVDHFKKYNDNHGHDAGDMVLRAVGTAMNQACDGDEIACRMGGEEFMLLLPGSGAAEGMKRAEALRLAMEKVSVRYGEKALPRITISVGVAVAPDHGLIPQDLLRIADEALYSAKSAGRNQVVLANSEPTQEMGAGEGEAVSETVFAPAAAHKPAPRVLVVENNEVSQIVMSRCLAETGLDFVIVANGGDAIREFMERRPGLIIVDGSLPDMDGFDVAEAIRKIEKDNPEQVHIIGIIDTDLENAAKGCREAGISDFITKPLSREKLLRKLLLWIDQGPALKNTG